MITGQLGRCASKAALGGFGPSQVGFPNRYPPPDFSKGSSQDGPFSLGRPVTGRTQGVHTPYIRGLRTEGVGEMVKGAGVSDGGTWLV